MHYLNRVGIPAPNCLGSYRHPTHTWDNVQNACKQSIRDSLQNMQSIPPTGPLRCAYCESAIYRDGHIEHFSRRRDFPHLTFEWDNLFLSCDSNEHCGHFKDRRGGPSYSPSSLIKPDQHNPDDFLYFHSNGSVQVSANCNSFDRDRADTTIRIFGLNNRVLRAKRRNVVKSYLEDGFLDELASWSPEDRSEYLRQEIQEQEGVAYSTTIRHFLESKI